MRVYACNMNLVPMIFATIEAAAQHKRERAARNANEKRLRNIEWQIHDQEYINQRKAEWAKTHKSARRSYWEPLHPSAAKPLSLEKEKREGVEADTQIGYLMNNSTFYYL
ncbi:MAG: hypothetical protein GY861_15160 [bacterium]|nr:hypothetical protein [bacterium]